MKIAVVIVTYNPVQKVLLNLVNAVKGGADFIFVIDNCSHNYNDFLNDINDLSIVTQFDANKGLATAQNYGVRQAINYGADVILFFDQDSAVDNNYIRNMLDDYGALKKRKIRLGVLGPRVFDVKDQQYYKEVKINHWGKRVSLDCHDKKDPVEASLVISSGCLIEVKVFQDVGLMKESYFIDYIDTEWCLRAINKGYINFISQKSILNHSIGDHFVSLWHLRVPMYSENRVFFRIRNAYWLSKCSHTPLFLGIREIFKNILYQLIFIFKGKLSAKSLKILLKANFIGVVHSGDSNNE